MEIAIFFAKLTKGNFDVALVLTAHLVLSGYHITTGIPPPTLRSISQSFSNYGYIRIFDDFDVIMKLLDLSITEK